MLSTASRRGRTNRSKGIRFERAIATKLRAEGFEVRRVLEYDGFTHGKDLQVGLIIGGGGGIDSGGGYGYNNVRWVPVAIQCKATQNFADGERGLEEAHAGNPSEAAWFCIHSFRRSGRRPQIRILGRSGATTKPNMTWDALVAKLKSLAISA